MKLKHLLTLLFVAVIFFNFSCTAYKDVPYFQDISKDSINTENIENFTQLTIQPNDLLGIHFTSLNPDASAMFNYNLERPNGNNNLDKSEENAVIGYLVDMNGDIHLPMVGAVNVKGLTTLQTSELLEKKLTPYLSQPKVDTRIQNFRISVLGDVKSPNTFNVYNERITVPEALSLAGDLNVTGIRKILLIREIDGKRTYIPFDLTKKDIFNSPYYYLKNRDVIYVQPNHSRVENDGTTFQKASIIVSLMSVIAILITR
ncbi:polysaccharide biosynthesis/export family protein [Mucilaginibacter segetis]|uniref:Polysaccharide biosynthesis/export family protein n=1 Tax=Mucilaginibacter segetis TaxID=2793071 RepID=A0A934UP24_9SPHI|nr:polysaccharide biosynthesis/export family protein [Mucilaginibacter segetis]MBK0380695.1 polysaccharide biosynthesis/export family protein [Mucilaginibacter segetis]